MRGKTTSVLIIPLLSILLVSAHAQEPSPTATPTTGETICAGNIPPGGMVITSTGDSPDCGGACRGRTISPLDRRVMIICAEQPVPEDYEIQSVTSSPSCNCLGESDNAYVIRAVSPPQPSVPTPMPMNTPAIPGGGSNSNSGAPMPGLP